jgi:Carboxypeptidase regulatory-like domain
MLRKTTIVFLSFLFITFSFHSCKKSDGPSTGKLKGVVTDAVTGSPLPNAMVIVFNADNNSPVGATLTTNAAGEFEADLPPGNYFVKISIQGYEPVPPKTMEAISFEISAGFTTQSDSEMFPYLILGAGWIQGKALEGSAGMKGALIVASDGTNQFAYSTVSAENGEFSIFNVPVGNYTVKAFLGSYNSNSVAITVSSNTQTSGVQINLEKSASATLTGSIRNLAVANKDVDIALVHPISKETIPGLTTATSNLNYTLKNIPSGTYLARATYKNDQRVMDPDRIAKFGEPVVIVTGATVTPSTLTFDITGSVNLNNPTNPLTTTVPQLINTTKPSFQWFSYSSTSDYIIEVVDASTGTVIWGGFGKENDAIVKNIVIPSSSTSVTFNSDGKGLISELVPGRVYRWRIFASKDDQNSPVGWTLISASEDQAGLIQVVK